MRLTETERQNMIIKATDKVFQMMMKDKKTEGLPDWIKRMKDVQMIKESRKETEFGFENINKNVVGNNEFVGELERVMIKN